MKLHSKDNDIFVRLQNVGFIKQECIIPIWKINWSG
ncbi:hypothetical protein CZ814_03639 [Photobacterium toruni]|uniref:Uncharacterized protein n=1 Tax=Photobacterium toruni TaxID=1935446 RepID=A0A1T4USP2_9GAMM|nr:hypothetical protein CZ814_03639 [Photobacterium toruni]